MNLPKDYQSKMQEMLGEEYLQYLDSLIIVMDRRFG